MHGEKVVGSANSLTVHRRGKYGVSVKEYKPNKYPKYCSEGGIIFSPDVIGDIP